MEFSFGERSCTKCSFIVTISSDFVMKTPFHLNNLHDSYRKCLGMKRGKRLAIFLLTAFTLISASCSLAVLPRESSGASVLQSPSQPQNLSAEVADRYSTTGNRGQATLALSWNAVEDATGYVVYYQSDSEAFDSEPSRFYSSLPQATVTVDSDDIYLVSVAAYAGNISNIGPSSGTVAVSTLRNIEDVSTVLSSNSLSVMIRHASTSYMGQSLIRPVFNIILTEEDGSPAHYADGQSVETDFIATGSSYSFSGGALAPSTGYLLTVHMGEDADHDNRLDEDEVFASWSSPTPFTTDADSYPDPVDSVVATRVGQDSIQVSFVAPPVKTGLENVQRRFSITRLDDEGNETEVWSRENILEFEGDTFFFTDTDSSLESNRNYQYLVTSWYYFEDSNAYNEQNESEGSGSNLVHIYSTPSNVTAQLERQGGTNTYTQTVFFNFSFGLGENDTVTLERRETTVTGTSTWETVEEPVLQRLDETFFRYSLSADLSLSDEDARYTHSYSYRVTVRESEDVYSQSASDNVVSTVPTVDTVLVEDFTATENLAGRVQLSWTTLDPTSAITVFRSTSSDYSGSEEITLDENGYDADVEDGVSYYYALQARGEDDFTQTLYASGRTLAKVEDTSATEGLYTDRVEIVWSGVEGAPGVEDYVVLAKRAENDGWIDITDDEEYGSGIGYDSESGLFTYTFTYGAGTSEAGRVWLFAVQPVDAEGHTASRDSLVTASGNLLGPGSIVVDASQDTYSDSILVRWNPVPGATQYVVRVYADSTTETVFAQEIVAKADTDGYYSFTFTSDDASSEGGYYLSHDWYFSIHPQYNSELSEEGTERVAGSWIKPPVGISASKAASGEATSLEWESVDNAGRYHIYRRPYGSLQEWESVADVSGSLTGYTQYDLDCGENLTNTAWEYTVSTVMGGVEGPVQTYFDSTSASQDPNGYPANVGFPLYHPENIEVGEVINGDYLLHISFTSNPYATGYQITPSVGNESISVDVSSLSDTPIEEESASDGDAYEEDGRIHVFMRRPDMRTSVHYSLDFISINSRIEHVTDRQSDPITRQQTAGALRLNEVVNLTNSVFSAAFDLANDSFGGDWWSDRGNSEYALTSGAQTVGTAHRKMGGVSYDFGESYLELNGYQSGRTMVSGHFGFGLDTWESVAAGFLGTDPVNGISASDVSVILPAGYGTATITYNSIQSGSGSYAVTTYDEDGNQTGSGTVQWNEVQVVLL